MPKQISMPNFRRNKMFYFSLPLTAEQRLNAKNQWTGCLCPGCLKKLGTNDED
jgi:hypothetical protein